MYLAGQICGIIGTAVTLIRPQMRLRVQMLFCSILVNAMSILNFSLIGKSGASVYLCMIAIVQCVVSILHERRGTKITAVEGILFFLLYMGFGVFGVISAEGFVWEISWANALETLPVIGALLLMLSVFAKTEQKTRLYLLFNAAAWMIYTAVAGATTFFSSTASFVSALAGLWKYRQKKAD